MRLIGKDIEKKEPPNPKKPPIEPPKKRQKPIGDPPAKKPSKRVAASRERIASEKRKGSG